MYKLCVILSLAVLLIGCSLERTEPTSVETKGAQNELPHAYIQIKAEGESDMPFPGIAKLWGRMLETDPWTELDSVQWNADDPRPTLTCAIGISGLYIKWMGAQTGQTSPPNSWEDNTGYYYFWAPGGQDTYSAGVFNYR